MCVNRRLELWLIVGAKHLVFTVQRQGCSSDTGQMSRTRPHQGEKKVFKSSDSSFCWPTQQALITASTEPNSSSPTRDVISQSLPGVLLPRLPGGQVSRHDCHSFGRHAARGLTRPAPGRAPAGSCHCLQTRLHIENTTPQHHHYPWGEDTRSQKEPQAQNSHCLVP